MIRHCNDLHQYMPFMLETSNHYSELLFPEALLSPNSFVRTLISVETIPEETWQEIEVIGWLYQFYIAEEKDRVFKEKKKFAADEIPYAN